MVASLKPLDDELCVEEDKPTEDKEAQPQLDLEYKVERRREEKSGQGRRGRVKEY